VVLGEESDLDRSTLTVGKLNMIKYDSIPEGMEAITKIRYKDKGSLATLHPDDAGRVNVNFFEAAKGVAPGQSAVFYEGDDVIGGGIIQRYMPLT
jgi:tRNA-specific 2-thiouridylase